VSTGGVVAHPAKMRKVFKTGCSKVLVDPRGGAETNQAQQGGSQDRHKKGMARPERREPLQNKQERHKKFDKEKKNRKKYRERVSLEKKKCNNYDKDLP